MKKFMSFLLLLISNVVFSSGVVNVYSTRHYDQDKKFYSEFERVTGIKVNVINGKDPSALIKKIKLEGKRTDADIFFTVGVGDLYTAKKEGILQPIISNKILANVPSKFRDKDNEWVGLSYRARILVYNPEKISVNQLSTYEDLASPKWKGKILTRSSTNSYNKHLIAFIIAKDGINEAKKWTKGLVNNFARDPKGNDREQAKAVYMSEGDIAIMNSYYMGKMLTDKDPIKKEAANKLKIFFPNQKDGGTHINLSGVGIVKESKNRANALKLVEFLTDKYTQEVLTNDNFEYPVNPKVAINPIVKSWGDFKVSTLDFDKIGENLERAKIIADEAKWK